MGAIEVSPEWQRFVSEKDKARAWPLLEALIARLRSEEGQELVVLWRRGSAEDRSAANWALMELARRHDTRLSETLKQEWLDDVRTLVREEYPNSPLAVACFQAWRDQEKTAAEAFLTEELPLERVKEESGFKSIVFQLRSFAAFGSQRALKRLEAMEGLPGKAAEERAQALRDLRPVTREEVEALAEDWRKTRSPQALYRIYDRYIAGLAGGTVLIEDLVKLLGPPTERHGNDVWYQPNQGTQLFLEGDANGRLRGRRFS